MSLELLNTFATLTTTIIVAVTAIAALVQLRHLRAGNQISGQLALRQVLLGDEFMTAMGRTLTEIPPLLEEPEFEQFIHDFHVNPGKNENDRYENAYAAGLLVGRNLENIGNMIRNGLTDRRIFLEQYANLTLMAWDAIEPALMIRRKAVESDAPWEDFEYLVVLARRWIHENGTCFPKNVDRILPTYTEIEPRGL